MTSANCRWGACLAAPPTCGEAGDGGGPGCVEVGFGVGDGAAMMAGNLSKIKVKH